MPYCPDWVCVGKEPDIDSGTCTNDCSKCSEPLDCSCIRCMLYYYCYPKEGE